MRQELHRHIANAVWAFAIVAVSLVATYVLNAAHITIGSLHPLNWLTWVASAPIRLGLIPVFVLAGGPHGSLGGSWIVAAGALLSFVMWFGIIEGIVGISRRLRSSP